MTRRLYCADIIKCEDFLYEDHDTLIAYAIENPDEFIGKVYEEIISVDVEDGLRITYTMVDDYDENDNEILKTEIETFDIEHSQMMVTVPDIRELFKSA
jgi:hypothetical protein